MSEVRALDGSVLSLLCRYMPLFALAACCVFLLFGLTIIGFHHIYPGHVFSFIAYPHFSASVSVMTSQSERPTVALSCSVSSLMSTFPSYIGSNITFLYRHTTLIALSLYTLHAPSSLVWLVPSHNPISLCTHAASALYLETALFTPSHFSVVRSIRIVHSFGRLFVTIL